MLDWENKRIIINGEHLSHLRFADHSLNFSNSSEKLENLAGTSWINVGLKMNLEKNKVVFASFASNKKIIYNNTDIKELQSYVYFG